MASKDHVYDDLKEMVEDEIDKIVKKGDLDEKGLMYLDKLVDIAKDVDTIYAMEDYGDENGYSQTRRPYYNDGQMMPMMGNSYQRRDSMGMYSRNNGNGRYGSYGYSREGDLADQLEQMINKPSTTDHEREVIRRMLDQM